MKTQPEVRVDENGVAHYAYLFMTITGENAPSPLGFSRRCSNEPSFSGLYTFMPVDAPTAERVTCLLCIDSELT